MYWHQPLDWSPFLIFVGGFLSHWRITTEFSSHSWLYKSYKASYYHSIQYKTGYKISTLYQTSVNYAFTELMFKISIFTFTSNRCCCFIACERWSKTLIWIVWHFSTLFFSQCPMVCFASLVKTKTKTKYFISSDTNVYKRSKHDKVYI